MTDTDPLAALLHAEFLPHELGPASDCTLCEQRAARLIAAGVRVAPSPLEKFDIAGMTQAEQESVAPSPDAPGLREAANAVVEWAFTLQRGFSRVPTDRIEALRAALASPTGDALDEDDWNNIMEALEVASSYHQEMQVNRERWLATLAKVATPEEPSDD